MTKATMATVKSFIKNNLDNLIVIRESEFEPLTDCIENCYRKYTLKAKDYNPDNKSTLGFPGIWFVSSGRNYIEEVPNGYEISNSCGIFIIKKAEN